MRDEASPRTVEAQLRAGVMAYVVTRDLSVEAPWAHTAGVTPGSIVTRFEGHTYGCCGWWETPVTVSHDPFENPFHGVPTDALMEVHDDRT